MKPVLLGYQAIRLNTSQGEIDTGRCLLASFAKKSGYSLGPVFVECDVNRPCSALVALIALARRQDEATAVAVPWPSDLGLVPRVRQMMRERITRETGLPVLLLGDFG